MSDKWTTEQIPDQHGRSVIVTGANSGLGLATARALAHHGATVVLACRDLAKGARAKQEIEEQVPDARLELAGLDLADLASVEAFAQRFRSTSLVHVVCLTYCAKISGKPAPKRVAVKANAVPAPC